MIKTITTLVIIYCFIFTSKAQSWEDLVLNENAIGLDSNPVRGIIPGWSGTRNFPYSMEYASFGLRNTMLGVNNFNWSELELKLEEIANRGNTAVVRFYLDSPGETIQTPQFLVDAGVVMNNYSEYGNVLGESASPDYNNPLTMNALLNFIENLGIAYDGDPRISVVQAGLVGFWGEWHTYPLTYLEMTNANKKLIFDQFVSAFAATHVNFRTPQEDVPTLTELNAGYHDDSFLESTLGPDDWHFWPTIIASGLDNVWQNHPIGGEIYPDLQDNVWQTIPNTQGQDFQTCVNTTHTTYLLNQGVFDDAVGSSTYNNALVQNRLLGYKFHVKSVKLNAFQNGQIDLDVRIENRGIAPFYYNWDVEFALWNQSILLPLGTIDWDIPSLMPGTIVEKSFTVNQGLQQGDYTILMRFVNPLTVLKPNAKQIRFANLEQDADVNGWISLVSFDNSDLGFTATQGTETSVRTYPNPFENELMIKCDDVINRAILYDLERRVIHDQLIGGKQGVISFVNLSSGVYFLEIELNNAVLVRKMVKK